MNSPLLVVIIVIVLVVGSTLSIMNKACKSGYHAWCAPIFTVHHHHVKTRPPANPARTSQRSGPSFKPRYSRMADVIAPRNIDQGLACSTPR
jgi:hypothetical protein